MDGATPGRPVIVGGGLAGLTAALVLAKAGLEPLVLEAGPVRCGGRLSAAEVTEFNHMGRLWRFPAEHGIHGVWSQYVNLLHLLHAHDMTPAFVPAQKQELVYGVGGRVSKAELGLRLRKSLIPAPFHYLALFANLNFLKMFGPLDLLKLPWAGGIILSALALDPQKDGARLAGLTAEQFLRGWPTPLKAFAMALGRSGVSGDPRDVPLASFLAFLRFYTLLRRDAAAFHYLAGDCGSQIIEPLVATAQKAGGRIVTGAKVTELTMLEDGDWRLGVMRTGDTAGSPKIPAAITASEVILALDSPSARDLLCNSKDTYRQAEKMDWPAGRATVIVRLWFKRSPNVGAESGVFGGDFSVDNFFWLHLFQAPFMQWHEATGGSAAEAHIYSPQSLLDKDDAVLLGLAVSDFVRAYPELRGELLYSTIQRNPPTHTLFSFGSAQDHLGVSTPWPQIYSCGDWVRDDTPSLFMEKSCVTAIKAANLVLERRNLRPYPLIEHKGPEPLAWAIEKLMRSTRRIMEAGLRYAP